MIKVKDYRSFWNAVKDSLGISKIFMVRTVEEMQKKLRNQIDADEKILVVVIPSSDSEGKNNFAISEKDTCVVYALMKADPREDDEETMMDNCELTQNIATSIKEKIKNQNDTCGATYHNMFREMDLQGIHTDPEWDVVGTGCEGWSVSFTLKSPGF